MLCKTSLRTASGIHQGLPTYWHRLLCSPRADHQCPFWRTAALKRQLSAGHGGGSKPTKRPSAGFVTVIEAEETILCQEIIAVASLGELLSIVQAQGHCFTCFAAAAAVSVACCLAAGRQPGSLHLLSSDSTAGPSSTGILHNILAYERQKDRSTASTQSSTSTADVDESAAVEILQRCWAPLSTWLPYAGEQAFADVLPPLAELSHIPGPVGHQAHQMTSIVLQQLSARGQQGRVDRREYEGYLRQAQDMRSRLAAEGRDAYTLSREVQSFWRTPLPPAGRMPQPLRVQEACTAALLLHAIAVLELPTQEHSRLVRWLVSRLEACMREPDARISAKVLCKAAYALATLGNSSPATWRLVCMRLTTAMETQATQQEQQQQQGSVTTSTAATDSRHLDAGAILNLCRAIAVLGAQESPRLLHAVSAKVRSRLGIMTAQLPTQHEYGPVHKERTWRGRAGQGVPPNSQPTAAGAALSPRPLQDAPTLLAAAAELASGVAQDTGARQLLRDAAPLVAGLIAQLSPKDMVQLLSAYARAKENVPEVVRAYFLSPTRLSTLSSSQLGQVLWCYAQLKQPDEQLFLRATPVLRALVHSMALKQHLQALCAYAWYFARSASKDKTLSRVLIDINLMEELVHALHSYIPSMTPQQVASLAWALCQLTWYDEAALAAVHKRVGFIYRQLMPGQLAPVLYLLALTPSCTPPPTLVDDLLRHAATQVPLQTAAQVQAQEAHIVRILWSCGVLGVQGSGAVQKLLHVLATHVGNQLAPQHCVPLAQAILSFATPPSSPAPPPAESAHSGDNWVSQLMRGLPSWLQSHPVQGLASRCLRRYLALTQSTSPSLTQRSVQSLLESKVSGVTSVRGEVTLGGGLFTVDLLVMYQGREVVVEVDGPSHFFLNRPGVVTGVTQWRRRRLQELGYTVAPVRAIEFMDLPSTAVQARLLTELLQLAVDDPSALEQRERTIGDAIGPFDHLPLLGPAIPNSQTTTSRRSIAPPNTLSRGDRPAPKHRQHRQQPAGPPTGEPPTRLGRGRRRRADEEQGRGPHVRAGAGDGGDGQEQG